MRKASMMSHAWSNRLYCCKGSGQASGQTISLRQLRPLVANELLRKLHVARHSLRQGHEAWGWGAHDVWGATEALLLHRSFAKEQRELSLLAPASCP